jgi:hypothetical protein
MVEESRNPEEQVAGSLYNELWELRDAATTMEKSLALMRAGKTVDGLRQTADELEKVMKALQEGAMTLDDAKAIVRANGYVICEQVDNDGTPYAYVAPATNI